MRNLKLAILATALFMSTLVVLANILPETEPNNTKTTAQTILLKDTLVGNIPDLLDQDWSKITLPQGTYRVVIDYPSAPAVRDWFELEDANGNELETECYYPTPTQQVAYFKVCNPSQVVYIHVFYNSSLGLSGADYHLVFEAEVDDPSECNDTQTTARVVAAPTVLTGKLPIRTDIDFGKFIAKSGAFSMSVNTPQQPGLPFKLALFKANNNTPIAQTASGYDLSYNLPADGTYYFSIEYTLDTASRHPYSAALLYTVATACNLTVDTTQLVSNPTVCGQTTGSLTVPQPTDGVAPYAYSINGGQPQANGSFINLSEGTYQILISDANGCIAQFSAEVTCITCNQPQIGINSYSTNLKTVQLIIVQQGVDSISVNYGDGTITSDLNHIYITNGNYQITVTGYNACGTAIATTTVSIYTAKFRVTTLTNVVSGSIVKIPVIVEEGNVQFSGISGEILFSNPLIADFIELQSGTVNISQIQYGNNNNLFAGLGNAQANQSFEVGDTVFYICVKAVGNPGDSTSVDIGNLSLSYFVNGSVKELNPTVVSGGYSLVRDVDLRIKIQTPTFLPVPGVEVVVVSTDTTITVVTDATGFVTFKMPYSTKYTLNCKKDVIVTNGINTVDAFILIRILVQLPNNGLNPYSYIMGDFDCSGAISINDPSSILNFMVGNIVPPCQQYVFLPASHVFGTYPSPGYFNFPTEYIINNPDAINGEDVAIVGGIRGDVNGNSIPNLTATSDDRTGPTTQWTYTVETENGMTKVLLSAKDTDAFVGGLMNLGFNTDDFLFEKAVFLQGKSENNLVLNDKLTKEGTLKMAFVNSKGNFVHFDKAMPLMELTFKPQNTDTSLDFKFIENEMASVIINQSGNPFELLLERTDLNTNVNVDLSVKVFPNPATQTLFVNLPTREATNIEIYDSVGKLVYFMDSSNNYQVEVPVIGFSEGIYMCKVLVNGRSTVQKFIVVK